MALDPRDVMGARASGRWVWVLLAVLLLSVPAAAAGRDQLTIGISQYPSTLHPAIDEMAAKAYVLGLTRRPLTAYDADWKLVCLLCTELPSFDRGTAVEEPAPGGGTGLAVTYTIRPGATWGDGVPVSTDDVLFTYQAGRDPRSGFDGHDLFQRDISNITVKDTRTFTVHLTRRTCEYQSLGGFDLLPAHLERPIFEADPTAYANRTLYQTDPTNPGLWFGPYRVVSVQTGSDLVLEPNPNWWGPPAAFRRIVVRAIENSAALEAALLAGDIDLIPGEIGLPLDQALALERRQSGRVDILTKAGLFFEHLDVNLDQPALADVRVRRALLTALDRDTLSRELFGGRQPVADSLVSPLDRMFDPDGPRTRFDPAAANRLLDEAGWTGRSGGIRTNAAGDKLSLTLATTAGNRSRELVEQVLQAQWRQVGVEVRIENQPARVLFGQTLRERRFDGLAMFAWISAPENIPRSILHSTMIPSAANGFSGQNYPGLRNPELDKVLDDLEVVCEPKANHALWARLQQLYATLLPSLPLYYRADATVKPKWLAGVVPTGHQEPSSLWVEQWTVTP
jgi:peptide/nickel transport system substrate-binding protein